MRTQYLETIARQILSESLGRYAGVDELVGLLSEGDASAEMVTKVYKMVAPWWVDAEAAGRLPLLRVRQPRRIAVINCEDDLQSTARMYAWRADFLNINECNFMEPAGGASGDLAAHYTDQISDPVRQRENRRDDYTDDRIIADLRKWTSIEYVVLPPPLPPQRSCRRSPTVFPSLRSSPVAALD